MRLRVPPPVVWHVYRRADRAVTARICRRAAAHAVVVHERGGHGRGLRMQACAMQVGRSVARPRRLVRVLAIEERRVVGGERVRLRVRVGRRLRLLRRPRLGRTRGQTSAGPC